MALESHITGENLQPHLFILRYYETLGSDDPYIIILTLDSFTCTCLPPKFFKKILLLSSVFLIKANIAVVRHIM